MAYIGVSPSNGVRTVFDYTATTGTSVVLDTGATVSDSVQIVVYDVFSVADTVSKANGGTFESNISIGGTLGVTGNQTNNGNLVVSKATPNVDIKDTGTAQASMDFLSNSDTVRATIGMERSAGGGLFVGSSAYAAVFGTASSGNTEFATNNNIQMKIDSTGAVTMPNQPAFLATPSTNQNDMSNSGNVTVVFGNEVYDQNSDFASNTFTAPVDGKYFLSLSLYLLNLDSAAGYYQITIDTSNRDYFHLIDPNYSGDLTYYGVNMGVVADMDANDTAFIRFNQNSGSAQTDINTDARFMGYLLG